MRTVNLVKYLCLIIDKELLFEFYINNLIIKLTWSVGILARARPFLTNSTILMLYYTLFHTNLMYDLIVCGLNFESYINKLSTLQNQAVKMIGEQNSMIGQHLFKILYSQINRIMFKMATCT